MSLQNHRRHDGCPSLLCRLWAVLALCALVFVQMLPGVAVAAGAGEWVEICSDSGVVLIQVDFDANDDGTPAQHEPCPDCANCAFCGGLGVVGLLGDALTTKISFSYLESDVPVSLSVAANPAQYWSANRGPPLAKEQDNSTSALVLAKVSTLLMGGAPWN